MSYVPIVTQGGINGRANGAPASADRILRILSEKKSRTASPTPVAGKRRGLGEPESFSIIVHCHLCWDWVWQRPQQFLSRLSARHKILFVETVGPDPQLAAAYARFRNADG